MVPVTKRDKQLQARLMKQNQASMTSPIDHNTNISSTFSNKALKIKQELITKINMSPKKQIFSCSKLLETMVYPDGKGEIVSPYLQKKAIDLLLSTLGKPGSSAQEIEDKI